MRCSVTFSLAPETLEAFELWRGSMSRNEALQKALDVAMSVVPVDAPEGVFRERVVEPVEDDE